jgi:hypothetical protein
MKSFFEYNHYLYSSLSFTIFRKLELTSWFGANIISGFLWESALLYGLLTATKAQR